MTVCLNMIVKDEAHVIKRCLDSVKDLIDHWVIVDTGSADTTAEVINDVIGHIPGELHEREWRDFGTNRTQALQLARGKCDYLLIIDADEQLITPEGYTWPDLDQGAYSLRHTQGVLASFSFWRMSLLRDDRQWRFVGVLHEFPASEVPAEQHRLEGPSVLGHFDSARNKRSNREKYSADADVLRAALHDEPDNERYVFYLAQSYRDAGMNEEAFDWYGKRVEMGRWDQEVWYSLYQRAVLADRLGRDPGTVIDLYLAAHDFRPTRAEALGALASYLRARDRFSTAKLFAQAAAAIAPTDDDMLVDQSYYTWRPLDDIAVADYWLGNYAQSADACRILLSRDDVPAHERARIAQNFTYATDKQLALEPADAHPGSVEHGEGTEQ